MNILFPGSFNPFHKGHQNICEQIAGMFYDPTLHVVQFQNPNKPIFTPLDPKEDLLWLIDVMTTSDLLIDEYCHKHNIDVIVRDMRSYKDPKEDAKWLSYVQSNTSCSIIYLASDPSFHTLSSTILRESYE